MKGNWTKPYTESIYEQVHCDVPGQSGKYVKSNGREANVDQLWVLNYVDLQSQGIELRCDMSEARHHCTSKKLLLEIKS